MVFHPINKHPGQLETGIEFHGFGQRRGPRKDLDSQQTKTGGRMASSDKVKKSVAILYKNSYHWEKSSEQPVLKD